MCSPRQISIIINDYIKFILLQNIVKAFVFFSFLSTLLHVTLDFGTYMFDAKTHVKVHMRYNCKLRFFKRKILTLLTWGGTQPPLSQVSHQSEFIVSIKSRNKTIWRHFKIMIKTFFHLNNTLWDINIYEYFFWFFSTIFTKIVIVYFLSLLLTIIIQFANEKSLATP